jgi:transketolase
MPFEDLGMMRLVPGLTILEPSDYYSCTALVREAAALYGSVYIRFTRKPVPVLYSADEKFEIGKAKLLRRANKERADALIIALGSPMVNNSLAAAEKLAGEGIEVAVLDVLTLKPLDREAILSEAAKAGAVLTAENAQATGGLGSAVAELLLEGGLHPKFTRIGINDEFGEVGTQGYLEKRFRLDTDSVAERVRTLLG